VRFLGHVEPAVLARLYERSCLLLHLSRCESFGLPVVEAMRFGLPVVAAARSALPEVAGGASDLVEPDDVASVAAAVARVADDASTRRHLVERGHARARALTWSATAIGMAEAIRAAAR
jgi:glycosyltransferase involved in cell wall biosynthesis